MCSWLPGLPAGILGQQDPAVSKGFQQEKPLVLGLCALGVWGGSWSCKVGAHQKLSTNEGSNPEKKPARQSAMKDE